MKILFELLTLALALYSYLNSSEFGSPYSKRPMSRHPLIVLALPLILFASSALAQPPNDDLANAQLVHVADPLSPFETAGTTEGATSESGEESGERVWYRIVTPPNDSHYVVDVVGGSEYPGVDIYRGIGDSIVSELEDVDQIPLGPIDGMSDRVAFSVSGQSEPGFDYLIGIRSSEGSPFELIVTLAQGDASGGSDAFNNATTLEFGLETSFVVGKLSEATVDPGETTDLELDAGPVVRSIWYRIPNPPEGSGFRIATRDAAYVSIYRSSPGGSIEELELVTADGGYFDYLFDDFDEGIYYVFDAATKLVVGSSLGYDYYISIASAEFAENFQGISDKPVYLSFDPLPFPEQIVVSESEGSVAIPVRLLTPASSPISFVYQTLQHSAEDGHDFSGVQETATIPVGSSGIDINIPLLDDSLLEPDKCLEFQLSGLTSLSREMARTSIWILDDDYDAGGGGQITDETPRLRRSGSEVLVETGGPETTRFRISALEGGFLRDSQSSQMLTVGDEFDPSPGGARLEASGPGLSLSIEALGPDGASGLQVIGVASLDLDGVSTETVFEFDRTVVDSLEGSMALIEVTSTSAAGTVRYEILPGTALPWDGETGDYLNQPEPLKFRNGRAVIEIPLFADGIIEESEHFDVRLLSAGSSGFLGPKSLVRVHVKDGDGPLRKPTEIVAAGDGAVDERYWPASLVESLDDRFSSVGALFGISSRIAPIVSDGPWINVPIAEQNGAFSFQFRIEIGSAPNETDLLVGLSPFNAENFPEVAAILRAYKGGAASGDEFWDAYDGAANNGNGGYRRENNVPLSSEASYLAHFEVNALAGRYSVSVTEEGEDDRTPIVTNASFRNNPATAGGPAAIIRRATMKSVEGSATISQTEVHTTSETISFAPQEGVFHIAFDLEIDPNEEFVVGFSDTTTAPMEELAGGLSYEIPFDSEWRILSGDSSDRYETGYDLFNDHRVEMEIDVVQSRYTIEIGGETLSGGFLNPVESVSCLKIFASGIDYRIRNLQLPPRAATIPDAGDGPDEWINIPIPPQDGRFSISYDLRISGDPINALAGLSQTAAGHWSEVSVISRAEGGFWNGRVGSGWDRTNDLAYEEGIWYRITLDVDTLNESYVLRISPEEGEEIVVLDNGTFRTPANELNFLSLRSVTGSLELANVGMPTAHPLDYPGQSIGRVESRLGIGSGVAVAEYAVLTSANLAFNPETFSYDTKLRWNFRYYENIPYSVLLTTGYSAGILQSREEGEVIRNSNDVAVLAFRPQIEPMENYAPALGGYSGFLVDQSTQGGSSSLLSETAIRTLSYFPATAGGFTADDHPTQISGPTSSLTSLGNGVYESPSQGAGPGSLGAPLFARTEGGFAHPCAVYLGDSGGNSRYRSIDGNVAMAIYRANLLQSFFSVGRDHNLAGREYEAEAVPREVMESFAIISGKNVPVEATWMIVGQFVGGEGVAHDGYSPNDGTLATQGGKAIPMEAGEYDVYLLPCPGYVLLDEAGNAADEPILADTYFLSAGDEAIIPKGHYQPADGWTYARWRDELYGPAESSAITAPSSKTPWSGIENLLAYAFGLDPFSSKTTFAVVSGPILEPGLPLVEVDGDGQFRFRFLMRATSDLDYIIEFTEDLTTPSLQMEAVGLDIDGMPDWKLVDTRHTPETTGGRAFGRVRVDLSQ